MKVLCPLPSPSLAALIRRAKMAITAINAVRAGGRISTVPIFKLEE
jgi:hypothetical protein